VVQEDQTFLRMEVERQGDTIVIRPHGRITELEAHELNVQMSEIIDGGARKIVADLADVPYMASSGLGAFMAAQKHGRRAGVAILIAALEPNVHGIFHATKLHKLFPIFDTVEEALAAT